jgi:RNase P subunit RPR2
VVDSTSAEASGNIDEVQQFARERISVSPNVQQRVIVSMSVQCPECKTQLRTEEERVIRAATDGAGVDIDCNKCGQPMHVERRLVMLTTAMPMRAPAAPVGPPRFKRP